jgi:hypothetical protein
MWRWYELALLVLLVVVLVGFWSAVAAWLLGFLNL